MLRGFNKLTNMLLHGKSPSCKMRLGGHNYVEEFNQPLNFVKASISIWEDFTHKISISKKSHSILTKGKKLLQVTTKGKKLLQVTTKGKKPLQAPREEEKLRHAPRKGKKQQQQITTSHAQRRPPSCHFCYKVGQIQWRCK